MDHAARSSRRAGACLRLGLQYRICEVIGSGEPRRVHQAHSTSNPGSSQRRNARWGRHGQRRADAGRTLSSRTQLPVVGLTHPRPFTDAAGGHDISSKPMRPFPLLPRLASRTRCPCGVVRAKPPASAAAEQDLLSNCKGMPIETEVFRPAPRQRSASPVNYGRTTERSQRQHRTGCRSSARRRHAEGSRWPVACWSRQVASAALAPHERLKSIDRRSTSAARGSRRCGVG